MHTKGKWVISKCSLAEAQIDASDMTIMIGFGKFMPLSMCEANAQLIASAPDLYEACKAVLNARDYLEFNRAELTVEIAIAKAEGK